MYSQDAIRHACKLYAVTDNAWLNGRSLSECVEQALQGGARFVQLRDKDASTDQLVHEAEPLLALCRAHNVPFVIDDDVEAARAVGADGVHVGQSDAACEEARAALGPDAIVGVSVQTVSQAIEAQKAGANYLGVGALIGTPTKRDADIVSKEELQAICNAVDIPVVGIGGLNLKTLECLRGTGVDGAAVVSAIFAAEDITSATQALDSMLTDVLGK